MPTPHIYSAVASESKSFCEVKCLPPEWLFLIFGSYNCAVLVFLAKIMSLTVCRPWGFALVDSLVIAAFRVFVPAIDTYLIHVAGNWGPGLWLSFAAMCGLAASPLARPQPVKVD